MKFETGDTVKYVGKSKVWKKGSTHIIYEVDYKGKGEFQYSTDHGAWFESSDFELVRKADAKSFKKLDKCLKEEGLLD